MKTPKIALGSSLRFLIVQGRWEWIILAIWIAYFIVFLFRNEPAKTLSPIRASTLLAGRPLPPPLPFEHTYFMDDPIMKLFVWKFKVFSEFYIFHENLYALDG